MIGREIWKDVSYRFINFDKIFNYKKQNNTFPTLSLCQKLRRKIKGLSSNPNVYDFEPLSTPPLSLVRFTIKRRKNNVAMVYSSEYPGNYVSDRQINGLLDTTITFSHHQSNINRRVGQSEPSKRKSSTNEDSTPPTITFTNEQTAEKTLDELLG